MTVSHRKSLRVRYALWTVLITGLLATIVLLSYAFFSYRLFLNDYEEELNQRMELVATSLQSIIKGTDYVGMMDQANSLLVTRGVLGVKILDVNSHPLIQKGSSDGLLLQRPISHNDEQLGIIQATFSTSPIRERIRSLLIVGGCISLLGTPLNFILVWFIVGHQLKDLRTLSDEVQYLGDIESEDINLTGIKRQDEVGHLARALAERNRAIRESKKLEQLLFHAINQSHDSVVITDADSIIEYVNPAFTRITGYSSEEAIGQNPSILQSGKHPAKFYQIMWETLNRGETWKGLIINRRKNGDEYQEEATITPVTDHSQEIHHYVAMKRDVSQEVILERKLARAEKMQAIGLMASGVAHDLNNILSGVVGYPEMLLLQLPPESRLRKPLEAIHESGRRAATVVADLLTVARGAAATREIHNLNVLIGEYLDSPESKSLQAHHSDVTIRQQFHADQACISCSPVHIKKCLMNLVTNSMEAISVKGTILISTENQIVVQDTLAKTTILPGSYVVLNVWDSGPGISEKDLEHIFEPFYSRKVMGRSGTGLGLAVVWNTMLDHKGTVQVTKSDEGTCFRLYFPVISEKKSAAPENEKAETFVGNGEHILIIDDEPQLRDIGTQMLKSLGYRVDVVSSGEEAIQFLEKIPVDLLMIDMLMDPGMNGRETYEEAVKITPGQKAIIVSGFSESEEIKAALKQGASVFVKKPYTISELGQAVQKGLSD